jgi:transposase
VYPSEEGACPACGSGDRATSSGATHRQRFNRRGNRQLNAALHRIAVTQLRMHEPAKDYVAKKRAEGKSKTEAMEWTWMTGGM